jgi:hypothetical protein
MGKAVEPELVFDRINRIYRIFKKTKALINDLKI